MQSRLEVLRSNLEKDVESSAGKNAEILRARAKTLAKDADKGDQESDCLKVVEFLLAHERYCIELIHVREVYPLKDLTPVPWTPPFVLGIINFRGQILSIVDLKCFFGLPGQEMGEHHRVIILHSEDMEFGILADAIFGVQSVPLTQMQPPLAGTGVEYIRGVTRDRVMILDGMKILSDKNIVVHQEI